MQKLPVRIAFCRKMEGMGHTLQIEGGYVYGLCGDRVEIGVRNGVDVYEP